MARKKKPLPILEGITITDVAAEGKCVTRVNDMVVFVPWVVPGDIVDLQVRRKKHSYAEAEVIRIVQESPLRIKPFCQHFGVCGGCKWQHLPYEEQLKAKQKQVEDQLRRIGKVELPPISPILGSEKTREYRNKLDFGCANKRYLTKEEILSLPSQDGAEGSLKDRPAIGFHITGAFDKILPIERCHLMDDLHNQIRNTIRDYAIAHQLTFFDLRQQTGLLRDVIIRHSAEGQWMVIVQFHFQEPGDQDAAMALLQHVGDRFPQITSLLWLDNQKCNDTIGDQDIFVFKGNDHIIETMENLRFKVGPKSFYQTNTLQAYRLYCVVRDFALNPSPGTPDSSYPRTSEPPFPRTSEPPFPRTSEPPYPRTSLPLIYDLYTGTGTIANFVAAAARQVIGIEYVPEAIEDAKVNSQLNGISNTLFFAGDMKDILTDDFIARHGRPDVIITDPPRAGMHPDVVKTILRSAPPRIVYVSCNPATQARDLQDLDAQYRVVSVQPVDMFPHTPHVENVVLLQHR